MNEEKGFITLATGKEEYFQLAVNLLYSYRLFCKNPLPFAIVTDRENEYTREFDDVVLIEGGASNSYLDKLRLGECLPYEENIFIDSDCLAYGDINQLFEYFVGTDDFSCFGRVLPLDDKTGWFEYENLGKMKERVNYVVGLHGGIYFMRRGEICNRVFATAKEMVSDYTKYKFKGKFATPGDEPLIALAMAVNQCKPIPFKREAICCYWEYVNHIKADISQGVASVLEEPTVRTILLHWGTRYTRELEYKKQVAIMKIMQEENKNTGKIKLCKAKYDLQILLKKAFSVIVRIKNKILRMIKSHEEKNHFCK